MVDYILDGLPYALPVADIDTVEADIDTSLLAKLLRSLISDVLLHVQYRDAFDSHLGKSLRHVETEPAPSAAKVSQKSLILAPSGLTQ